MSIMKEVVVFKMGYATPTIDEPKHVVLGGLYCQHLWLQCKVRQMFLKAQNLLQPVSKVQSH